MRRPAEAGGRPLVAALLAALALGLPACAYVRSVTYPPDFTYLSNDDVSSSMGIMSRHVSNLENLLGNQAMPEAQRQQAVLAELDSLDTVARHLGAGPTPTNHLYIDAQIDRFQTDLQRARFDAERDPPNYYRVGRIAGTCAACHLQR